MEIVTVVCRRRGAIESAKSFKDGDTDGENRAYRFFVATLKEYFPGITTEEAEEYATNEKYSNSSIDIEIIHSNLVGID